jgi:hypothetical protein
MALLSLLYLLQATENEAYRYALFQVHDLLLELAKEFAPRAVSALENLRPRIGILRKQGQIAFSKIDHPKGDKVPGSVPLGPDLEDQILNFHALRLTNPNRERVLQFGQ